jgi:hypothetical protein
MTQPSFHIIKPGQYKVMYKSQLVGRIQHSDDGTYRVTDIRQFTRDAVYVTRDEAFMHFLSFNWSSVTGRSSLVTLESRVIRRNEHVTKRWAFY